MLPYSFINEDKDIFVASNGFPVCFAGYPAESISWSAALTASGGRPGSQLAPGCSHLEDAKNHMICVPSLSDAADLLSFDNLEVLHMNTVDVSQSVHGVVVRVTPTRS